MKTVVLLCAAMSLAACSTPEPIPPDPMAQAVATPLNDLNLVHAPIPPALSEALKAPYAMPADASCDSLGGQVKALDAVLGTDLDAPRSPSDPGLVERGANLLGAAATDTVRGAAEGAVPFRSWIRRLTGAERYSREVAAAIAAGAVRRSFLKGLGQARGCVAPAAPLTTSR